jgi:hypothetical protein
LSSFLATTENKNGPEALKTPAPIRTLYAPYFYLILGKLEAATGFEPVNNGFADRCLTTWLCRLVGGRKEIKMERETGFEPATSTLARLHSTTELFPLLLIIFEYLAGLVKGKIILQHAAVSG